MFGVAYGRLRNREDAEDAVQDGAVLLLRQHSTPDDERGLAYTMADYATRALQQRERYRLHERLDPTNPDHARTSPSAEREALARIDLSDIISRAPAVVVRLAAGYGATEQLRATGEPTRTIEARARRWREREQEVPPT